MSMQLTPEQAESNRAERSRQAKTAVLEFLLVPVALVVAFVAYLCLGITVGLLGAHPGDVPWLGWVFYPILAGCLWAEWALVGRLFRR